MSDWPWSQLGCAPTIDPIAIKRAYARTLKTTRPDDDPQGYQQLRYAYEVALQWARDAQHAPPERTAADAESPTAGARPETAQREEISPPASEAAASEVAPEPSPAETPQAESAALTHGPTADAALPTAETAEPRLAAQAEAPRPTPADDQAALVARIRRKLSSVDTLSIDALEDWWRSLEPDLALVPLSHRDSLSRQMAQYVAERPGFPHWLVRKFADQFDWDRDFRREADLDAAPELRARLRQARALSVRQRLEWRRLFSVGKALEKGRRAFAMLLALLYAPRLGEQFQQSADALFERETHASFLGLDSVLWHASMMRWAVVFAALLLMGATRETFRDFGLILGCAIVVGVTAAVLRLAFGDLAQRRAGVLQYEFLMPLMGYLIAFAALVACLLDYQAFADNPLAPYAGAMAWIVISVSAMMVGISDSIGRSVWFQKVAVDKRMLASVMLAGIAVGTGVAFGWWIGLAVGLLAILMGHVDVRWRSIWLPLLLAPLLGCELTGTKVPDWLPGVLAIWITLTHSLLVHFEQRALAIFGMGWSDLNLGVGSIIFVLLFIKVTGSIALIVFILALPATLAVHARTYGRAHAIGVIALATGIAVLYGSESYWIVLLAALFLTTHLARIATQLAGTLADRIARRIGAA